MSYKVGDLVRVKPRSWFYGIRGGNYPVRNPDERSAIFVTEMTKYCGKTLKVCTAISTAPGWCRYRLENVFGWVWEDWMLEGVVIENVKECPL
jgi:hypothetical protein